MLYDKKKPAKAMKTRILLTLLGFTCCLSLALADCNLSERKTVEADFPDILQYVGDSYIMGVEYSTPKANETNYFTEYYEVLFARGRIESHERDSNTIFIYRSESEESWTLENGKCKFQNLTATPEFFKKDQTEWFHFSNGTLTTVGPSAMLKTAFDVWKIEGRKEIMAFMGVSKDLIRGEKAVYWRRCSSDKKRYVDYYFADPREENAFDTDLFKKTITPLRVSFYGVSASEMEELNVQHYDIISFQHFIPKGVEPFQLPKGKNCSRSLAIEGPKLTDFTSSNLFISSEVVYRNYKTGATQPEGTYYSSLMFALDLRSNHTAYYYSAWDTTSNPEEDKTPFVGTPEYNIFDIKHGYAYKMNLQDGSCEVSRQKKYFPSYKFPNNAGALDLVNQYVFTPNNELSYLTSGTIRGLAVNIYEASVEMLITGKNGIPEIVKALVTHSYLKPNIKLESAAEVSGALVEIDIRLFRKEFEELITFNLFGFSTTIPMKERIFDVTRCFRNDDDYSVFTVGFEVEPKYLPSIPNSLPKIEESVLGAITGRSELNAVRIPFSMSNLRKGYVFVTLVVLQKPDLQMDFSDNKTDTTVSVANIKEDTEFADFKTCANKCVEERTDCWGFSMCGATCYYGSDTNTNVETKKGCNFYTKYNASNYMQSKELQIENLRHLVDAGELMIYPLLDNGERVELVASFSRVDEPGAYSGMFKNLGQELNPRMTIQKPGTKLKGTEIQNMGKLAYDECQSLCLDFKNCESVSYCIKKSACVISTKYGNELKADEIEADDFCILLARKYADHFDNTPGLTVKGSGGTTKEAKTVEDCARACLKESGFSCLSFDHCVGGEKETCTIYKSHYVTKKDKSDGTEKNTRCGHYSKKFSNEFARKDKTRLMGSKISPIFNLTLEECAKNCVEYGEGTCYGYDFCQDATLYGTSCTLYDKDPSRLDSVPSKICSNYVRSSGEYAPRPFTNSYAGGIGFLCFIVGGILGAIAIFVIAYIRVNRRG